MSTTAAPDLATSAPLAPVRANQLDRLRGAAVALMVLDHLLIVTGNGEHPLRYTLTRAAMPLFAILAGHLVTRLSWRWADCVAIGLILPAYVPWIDSQPNILILLTLGAALIVANRRWGRPGFLWVGVALPVALFANGLLPPTHHGYQTLAVIGLMFLGNLANSFSPSLRGRGCSDRRLLVG